jgi:hypothetical protein
MSTFLNSCASVSLAKFYSISWAGVGQENNQVYQNKDAKGWQPSLRGGYGRFTSLLLLRPIHHGKAVWLLPAPHKLGTGTIVCGTL